MKKVTCLGHQGDVIIFEVDQFPEADRTQDEMTKKGQLALGELTGHHHAFTESEAVDLFKVKDPKYTGLSFFETKKDAKLYHGRMADFKGKEPDQDYHNEVSFEAGKKYMTGIVHETDWLTRTVRRVMD